MINQTVSHYRILKKIGAGGMGEVYLAEDTKLERKVALKFLPPQFSADDEEKKRFIHEAKAAASINHANIVTVYETGEHEGHVFIAMEYVAGKTLKDLISVGTGRDLSLPIAPSLLPLAQVLDIASQLASGLAAAHAKGIIHRDLKPANVMLTDDGVAKIVDFGLAKLKGMSRLTKSGTTLGTVAYMSPEQALGKEVDQRSDIWSLGVILYEMLTGKLPFPGEYDQAMLYAVINEEPQPVTALRSGVPIEFDRILAKVLAKDRGERYQHLADFVVDLRRAKKDSQPSASPILARKKAMPRFLYPALAVAMAAVAIGGFLWLKNKRPVIPVIDPAVLSSKPSLAVFYFENKTGRKDLDIWRDGLANLLITDLSQSKYLRVLSEERLFSLMKDLGIVDSRKNSFEEIKKVALKGDCKNVIHGNFLQSGKNFIITASLQDATSGEIIASFKAFGEGEESITTSIDEITRKIKLEFPLTAKQLADDVDVGIGQVTTRSPEALKYYLAGRRFHHQAELLKALEMMNKAIELDPAFAMAYSSASASFWNMGNSKKAEEYLKKALQYSDRVSIKERELIRAQAEPDPVKLINMLSGILNEYPEYAENEMVWRLLGSAYYRTEDNERSLQAFKKAYSLNSDSWVNCFNVLDTLLQINPCDYTALEAMISEFSARHPESQKPYHMLAVVYTTQRKWRLADQVINKYYLLNPQAEGIPAMRGDLAFFQGDWARAEAEYDKISDTTEQSLYKAGLADTCGKTKTALKHWREVVAGFKERGISVWERSARSYLAAFHYREGNFREALAEVERIEQLGLVLKFPLARAEAHLQRALIHTTMGDRQQGEKYFSLAAETLGEEDKQTFIWQELVCRYRGQMEFLIGNYKHAIDLLQRFLSMIPYQHYNMVNPSSSRSDCLFMIALAHFRLGDLQSAIRELEEIPTLTYGLFWNPHSLARSYLLAGQIYQKLGQRDKALEKYRLFVDIWKECDPPLRPLVNEARREIEILEKRR